MSLEYSSEDPKFSGLAAEWLERRSFIDSELDEKNGSPFVIGLDGIVNNKIPNEKFMLAWAWSDRLPSGLPAEIPGPLICDASLRENSEKSSGALPKDCHPELQEQARKACD